MGHPDCSPKPSLDPDKLWPLQAFREWITDWKIFLPVILIFKILYFYEPLVCVELWNTIPVVQECMRG